MEISFVSYALLIMSDHAIKLAGPMFSNILELCIVFLSGEVGSDV